MGLDELIKSLKSDFQKEKEEILKQAKTEAQTIIEEEKKKIETQKASEKKKLDERYELKKKRSLLSLNSQIKLERNKFKGSLLNKFLDELRKEILKLKKIDYESLYMKFLEKEIYENDMEVYLGSKEKKLDKKFVENLSKNIGKKLNFKGTKKDFEYGIILIGNTFEINLSFDELLKNIKDDYLLKISSELFNEK